jgi:GntR family transcriptional repressor for pyruvate dehydrogenase complex
MRYLISSGEFKIGDKLPTEKALGERFGIGRSSIREVIKILHYVGVLKSSTGKGTYLLDWRNISSEALTWTSLLSENDFFELMDVRFSIENRCICSLTEDLAKGDPKAFLIIYELKKTIERMKTAAEQNDPINLIEADYEFHNLIIKSHQNSVFSSIYEVLRSFLIDATKDMLGQYSDPQLIFLEHKTILEKIIKGDVVEVTETYLKHTKNSKSLIRKIHKNNILK